MGIGERVRAARERLDWSREALAFHSGLSWSGIAQIETGRRTNLRPSTLTALAGALGVSVDYLLRGGPGTPPLLEHRALIYRTDEEFVQTAAPFLAGGVERSEALLAVTTQTNIDLLRGALGEQARHVEFAVSADRLRTPESALSGFRAFLSSRLEAGAPWARLIGEPIWEGRSRSEISLWTRFESLLNLVFGNWPLSCLCAYDERSVPTEITRQARLTHPQTIERGRAVSSPGYVDPGNFVLE